jgi:hypothetical protein
MLTQADLGSYNSFRGAGLREIRMSGPWARDIVLVFDDIDDHGSKPTDMPAEASSILVECIGAQELHWQGRLKDGWLAPMPNEDGYFNEIDGGIVVDNDPRRLVPYAESEHSFIHLCLSWVPEWDGYPRLDIVCREMRVRYE